MKTGTDLTTVAAFVHDHRAQIAHLNYSGGLLRTQGPGLDHRGVIEAD